MKRYSVFGMVGPRMLEDNDGDYVRYSDVDRLTAAAPEMLEALKECSDAVLALTRRLYFINDTPMLVVRQAYAAYGNALAAIAKAEGRGEV